jgi:NAD(P)H dehydrogenase (quinone)
LVDICWRRSRRICWRDDIAAAIAGGLASDVWTSATLELTGPKAYSTADVAAFVTDMTGRPIEIVQVSDEALCNRLQESGILESTARLLASADANVRAGHSDHVNDMLERLSRRKPMTLKAFLEANKMAFMPALV